MNKCHVVGIQYIFDEYEVYDGQMLTLPGNVQVNLDNCALSSDMDYVSETYGETEYMHDGQWVSYLQYIDSNCSNAYLRFDQNDVLYYMWYRCYEAPKGAAVQVNSTVDILPLCEVYEAPGATADRYDDIINIEGYNYKMRCPVSEYINNGWTINVDLEYINPSSTYETTITKGGASLNIILENPTIYKIKPEQSIVVSIGATEELSAGVDITFPGGVRLGMNDTVMNELFSDVDGFVSVEALDVAHTGESSFGIEENVPDGGVIIDVKFVQNEDGSYRLTEYSYERSKSTLDMDVENTDYIQGVMVNDNYSLCKKMNYIK